VTVRNPTRRSRNIGTAAQGHGANNRLVIPRPKSDRVYWESVTSFELEKHFVHGNDLLLIREALQPGWFHPCSTSDILRILQNVPAADLASMNCILFRQPTSKQTIMNPSWGRLTYHATVGVPGKPDVYRGPLITLEACRNPTTLKWSKSLGPDGQKELDRLRNDGHSIEKKARYFQISGDSQAIRNTQLHRTLLHEIGHWVDYLEKVERPSETEPDSFEQLSDKYFARPHAERESFAHRYSDRLRREIETRGVIPFQPNVLPI
jgi:hypothetical protein